MLILDGEVNRYPDVKPDIKNDTVFLVRTTRFVFFSKWQTIMWDVEKQKFRRDDDHVTAWVKMTTDSINTGL